MGSAIAQGDWGFQCIDPLNTQPRSTDHLFSGVGNDLFRAHIGLNGTVTYGGPNGPCYGPASLTLELQGRFGFMIGDRGSIQDEFGNQADPANENFRDDSMVLTPGMPFDPSGAYCYAMTTRDSVNGNGANRTLFGSAGFNVFFVGASGRYFRAITTQDNIRIVLTVDVAGDAARYQWDMTNLDTTTPHNLGLWFGSYLGMLTNPDDGVTDRNGANQSHLSMFTLTRAFSAKEGYLTLPSGRPPVTERRYIRAQDPSNFPQVVQFHFSQTAAQGLRIENGETPATHDPLGQFTPAEAYEFVLGNAGRFAFPGILGFGSAATFPDTIIGDVTYLDNTGFLQKFTEKNTPPNGTSTFVEFFRSTWSVADYSLPYAAVVDGPQLVANDPAGLSGLRPNPMTIRVYVDNVRGYANAGEEVQLEDVKVSVTLPNGLSPSPGEPFVDLNFNNTWDQNEPLRRVIGVVPARQVRFIDFSIEADGVAFGDLEYTVKVDPIPGTIKTLTGHITVATTPKVNISSGANLVTLPWVFTDTSLEAILGMQIPIDFQAFKWDPELTGYVPATNNERGKAYWITTTNDFGPIDLLSNPTTPPDMPTGAPLIQLKSGWNLVGNPYPYAIQLGQLVGVSAAAPQQAYPWAQLVAQGFMSGSLVFWDNSPTVQDYVFIQGGDATIQPNRGYWVFVPTLQDLTISYPSVFIPYLPGSNRAAGATWVQSANQWRLRLSARTDKSLDAQNYVGIAKTAADVMSLRIYEPPRSPVHNVELSIEETINGSPTRLAQALGVKAARKTWKVMVETTEGGTVTVTWPNLSTVPKDVRFRLTDRATGEVRDLRRTSGYTFTVEGPSSRELTIEATPGGQPIHAVIGNVVVSRNRAPLSPFVINYTLSSDASTTVRILSGGGREVFTITRGRADRIGTNSVQWAVRDNANRLVAPGTYLAEIIAETDNGERVRKVIPLNVIR